MTGLKIFDGYGQTETILTCGNFADSPVRPGSMGKPTPGVPLHVIDPDGADCQENVEGDIAILVGANDGSHFFGIFDGYLNREGTLDQRIMKLGQNSWYLTGDRATRDEQVRRVFRIQILYLFEEADF